MGFHTIKISGAKSSKEKAPILVCAPHATIVDAIAVFASGSVPVAKQGVAKMYFIGPVFSFIQSLFVTREAASSRQQTVDQIKSRACDLEAKESQTASKWPQVFIFPEGTCTNSRALIKFKSGAFLPGVPVQPVLIMQGLLLNGNQGAGVALQGMTEAAMLADPTLVDMVMSFDRTTLSADPSAEVNRDGDGDGLAELGLTERGLGETVGADRSGDQSGDAANFDALTALFDSSDTDAGNGQIATLSPIFLGAGLAQTLGVAKGDEICTVAGDGRTSLAFLGRYSLVRRSGPPARALRWPFRTTLTGGAFKQSTTRTGKFRTMLV